MRFGISNILILAGLALSVAVGIFLYKFIPARFQEDTWLCVNNQWVKHGHPASAQPVSGCGETIAPKDDFSQTGNITNFDAASGRPVNFWTLLYEKPGAPALNTKLVFTSSSRCDLGDGSQSCEESSLVNGLRVSVSGITDQNQVIVSILSLIK
jgi:hypothetical protein